MNSNKKPKIGIPGWSTGEGSFGATKAYLHYLGMFGDVVILCPTKHIYEDLDLVVMPGGTDASTVSYGQVPGYYNSNPDQFKEAFSKINLPLYIEAGIPVFGICLGFQMLLVHFGCSLVQNINITEHGYSDVEKVGRGDLVNTLIFTKEHIALENSLKAESGLNKIKCCSLHHQGVRYHENKKLVVLPESIDPIAYTSDGILEAFAHRDLPVAGIQSHPEEDFNYLGIHLINSLLKRSPNYKNEDIRVLQKS